MGEHSVKSELKGEQLRQFTRRLLADLQALEQMLEQDVFERKVRRIGAEQELFLVDSRGRPAPIATDVLNVLADPDFTTELARFNLEFNLAPLPFGGDCLRRLEDNLTAGVAKARTAARSLGADVALMGILPTLRRSDLTLDNMTPSPRYFAINQALTSLRGSAYELSIKGIDELNIKHDSVMLEACNTSFQVHFQVAPSEFAKLYNVAQVVTSPVLAAATNAPLLFGRRLWRESRIALFEQSIDTRREADHERAASARVSFGRRWVKDSVLEIYREDVSRFKVILGLDGDTEDPFEVLAAGGVPKLQALQLHLGTIYRWNRACYGVHEGRPHLRIECRVLPSGPTPIDEVANAAFFFGLMSGLLEEYGDVSQHLSFDNAKANFMAAARSGLKAQFEWLDGQRLPAHELICKHLIPLAKQGLEVAGVRGEDIDRYLGVLEQRVGTGRTGAQWVLGSLDSIGEAGTQGQRMASLVTCAVREEEAGRPAHEWPLAQLQGGDLWSANHARVGQYMTTDLLTVDQDEPIDLVANLMLWNHLRHVPVEDAEHRLVGVVSAQSLLRVLAQQRGAALDPVPVNTLMDTEPVFIAPETSTLDALKLMKEAQVSCLPVVEDGQLVGLVTDSDFLRIASQLVEEKLRPV